MDIPNPNRHRPRKSSSPSERFLGAYPHAPPNNPISNPNTSADYDDELTEDDIFWTNDIAVPETNHHTNNNNNNKSTPPSSASSTPRRHNHKGFPQPESFGILAALPEREASSPNPRPHSHLYHKASASSSSSSSSPSYAQLIPTIPKPPPPLQDHRSFHYQSAPVNVPVLIRKQQQQLHRRFEPAVVDDGDEDEDEDGEMLPPHEIVARSAAHSPMLACSVLEGVGRTLKGRDLRRVRNAVWRQTGFLD